MYDAAIKLYLEYPSKVRSHAERKRLYLAGPRQAVCKDATSTSTREDTVHMANYPRAKPWSRNAKATDDKIRMRWDVWGADEVSTKFMLSHFQGLF